MSGVEPVYKSRDGSIEIFPAPEMCKGYIAHLKGINGSEYVSVFFQNKELDGLISLDLEGIVSALDDIPGVRMFQNKHPEISFPYQKVAKALYDFEHPEERKTNGYDQGINGFPVRT